MYNEYFIQGKNDDGDIVVYWVPNELVMFADIKKLEERGYFIEFACKVKIEKVLEDDKLVNA